MRKGARKVRSPPKAAVAVAPGQRGSDTPPDRTTLARCCCTPSLVSRTRGGARIEVELIGGRLFKHSVVAVGAAAIKAIARVRADIYFMGVTGVHAEMGLRTSDPGEAAVKRSLSRQAAETIVLASHEKLGAVSPFVIMPLSEVDMLIVEKGSPHELIDSYRRLGLTVVAA